MNRKALLLAAATLAAGTSQAACYGVYKADGTLLQETATTPVDLRYPLGDTVPLKFGAGATMTISSGFQCRDQAEDVGAQESLAAAVLAEEKKAMVLKGSAAASAADAPAPMPVQVAQEAPAKTVQVVRQEGNVLKVKGKEGQ